MKIGRSQQAVRQCPINLRLTFKELKTTPKDIAVGIVVARYNFDAFESHMGLVCRWKEPC